MATVNINGVDLDLVFIENGGAGAGTSPTDSLGALPTPSSLTNAIYVLRKNATHTWTFASGTRTNSTNNLSVAIVGAPTSGSKFYESITTSSISGDANLMTWLTENTSAHAVIVEEDGASRQSIEFTGSRQSLYLEDLEVNRNGDSGDDSDSRLIMTGVNTNENTRSNAYFNNVVFKTDGYDMNNPGGSWIAANRERSGIEFNNMNMVALNNVEVQSPLDTGGLYPGTNGGIEVNDSHYVYLINVICSHNLQTSTSGPPRTIALTNIKYQIHLEDITMNWDFRSTNNTTNFTLRVASGLYTPSTPSTCSIFARKIRGYLRDSEPGPDNPTILTNTGMFDTGGEIYSADVQDVILDMSQYYSFSSETFVTNPFAFVGLVWSVNESSQSNGRFPSIYKNIRVEKPNVVGSTNTAMQMLSIQSSSLVQDVTANRPYLDSESTYALRIQGESSNGPKVDRLYINGRSNFQICSFVNVVNQTLGIDTNQPAIDVTNSNVYVQTLDIGGSWTTNCINANGDARIYIDDLSDTIDETLVTISNDIVSNVYVNKMDSGNVWLGLSNSFKGITSNVTRTSGGDFSLQLNQTNTNYSGEVYMAPEPFPGIALTLPTSGGGTYEFIAYAATVDMDIYADQQRFILDIPQSDGSIDKLNSGVIGVWENDTSIWSDAAVQGINGQARRMRMVFTTEPGTPTVYVRFRFVMFESGSKYMYIDPQFIINEL